MNRRTIVTAISALVMGLTLGVREVGAETVVVSPDRMHGWGVAEETLNADGQFVAGPETTPLGVGSVQMTTDNSTGGFILFLLGYQGTRLDQIDQLEYSTYVDLFSTSSVQTISLQFNIDDDVTDGDDGWKGRLVFEPYYTETVTKGIWQTWNPQAGKWWGTGAAIRSRCPISKPCTWIELLTFFPNIGIHNVFGAALFKAGSGWPAGFNGSVDAFTITVNGRSTTYDFEAGKDACKNGGWQASANPLFKNQGRCIQYIETSK